MLDCQGGKVRIRCEVTGGTRCVKQFEQDVRVAISGMYEKCLRPFEPRSDPRAGAADIEGIVENSRICGESDELQDRRPGKPDASRAVKERFPLLPCCDVSAELGVVGVQQQVDVGNDHRASRRADSSASSSSTS